MKKEILTNFYNLIKMPFGPKFIINSKETLGKAVELFSILPFFPNIINGLSIEEMCAPGLLFGGNYDEGCWEWKGPIIRQRNSIYGKFFNKKAGFVSKELVSDFLNYRRASYPIKEGSLEEMLWEIIRENDSITSSDLKNYIFGAHKRRNWEELPEIEHNERVKGTLPQKRKSLEGPLQRLQMGGWIIISDFEYKVTKKGERYGWGVARYSTPEGVFGDRLRENIKNSPEESLKVLISHMKKIWPLVSTKKWEKLLK